MSAPAPQTASVRSDDSPTLATIYANLGSDLLTVALAPLGLEITVADAIVHDPGEPLVAGPGDIVLAIGIDPASEAARSLIAAGAQARIAALVVKCRDRPIEQTLSAAEAAGVAILITPPEMAWGQLHALIRTSATTAGSFGARVSGTVIGDLFGLADAIAAAAGGPVTIEDPQSRVLAFSYLDAPIDSGRQATILGRRVPDIWMRRLRETGVFSKLTNSADVVHVEFPGQAVPRRAIAVRAGGTVLGSIWLAEGSQPLTNETDVVLEESARIAALHLLRQRVSDDLKRLVAGDMVRALLLGDRPVDPLADELGLPADGSFAVIAVQAVRADVPTAALVHERVVDLLAVYFQAFRRPISAAVLDGRVYLIVSSDPARPRSTLLRLTRDALESTSKAVKVSLQAGVGAAANLADVPCSRAQADQALRLAGSAADDRGLVDIEDVYGQALMLEVADFLATRSHPRARQIRQLAEHDREHATDYLQTLGAYLDVFGDSVLAAERLGVHPNTLRYRIRRIFEIADIDLHDPDVRFPIELQLRMLRGTS